MFSANLLGILIGGIIVLETREPYFREKLQTQNRSRLPLLIALVLAVSVGEKLYGHLKRHVYAVKIEDAKVRIEGERKGEFESPKTTSQQFHVKEIFSTPRISPD